MGSFQFFQISTKSRWPTLIGNPEKWMTRQFLTFSSVSTHFKENSLFLLVWKKYSSFWKILGIPKVVSINPKSRKTCSEYLNRVFLQLCPCRHGISQVYLTTGHRTGILRFLGKHHRSSDNGSRHRRRIRRFSSSSSSTIRRAPHHRAAFGNHSSHPSQLC